MKYKNTSFELKKLDENGKFSGYGAVFGNIDSYRDVIVKGAFTKYLKEKKRNPALLWQHKTSEVSGVIHDLYEDDYGLFMEGELALKVQRGMEAYELMKMGAISGLSIGFEAPLTYWDKDKQILELREIKLWEISIVTFPANELARIEEVKQILESGGMPTERELEGFLKELGFSRNQAKTFISKGYKAVQRDADMPSDDLKNAIIEVKKLFNQI